MTASEKLYDIFSPALDSYSRISLDDAEQLVSEAGLNVEEEFGFDNLQDTIEELDNHFVLEEVDGTTYIKCLNVQPQDSPEEELPPTVEDETPAEKEEVEEQQKNVEKTIRKMKLTKVERDVLNCYMAGMTFVQIARFLGVDNSTVWHRRQRLQIKYMANIK